MYRSGLCRSRPHQGQASQAEADSEVKRAALSDLTIQPNLATHQLHESSEMPASRSAVLACGDVSA